jgi:regulatory protein
MTTARLERIALAHLQRHGASRAHLRRLLQRRIARSCEEHEQDPSEFEAPLEALLSKLERLGYLDDRRYGASLVRRARARGASRRELRARLRQKGLAAELVEALLEADAGDGSETEAAWRYARRRGLGPFRSDADERRERRQRDLEALGRRGFGFDTASAVIDADPDDTPGLR